MTKYVMFESDPVLIKRGGDNRGYIYNPAGLFYLGETFNVRPGEPIMIIPHQPADCGPWKQCRTAFEDGRFLRCKEEETLTIMIENRCPNQIFKVSKGSSLAELLNRWGMNHEMSFITDRQLEKIENYQHLTTDTEYNDDQNKKLIKPSKKSCNCDQC